MLKADGSVLDKALSVLNILEAARHERSVLYPGLTCHTVYYHIAPCFH